MKSSLQVYEKLEIKYPTFHSFMHNKSVVVSISSDLEGGRFFFNAVREGESILYATEDENESHQWVTALYRATGQAHKPTPPVMPQGKNSTFSKIQGGRQESYLKFSGIQFITLTVLVR